MWIRNVDNGKWSIYQDVLSKDNYDSLKQDLESIKFYSKCLSGSTYLLINQFDNIYDSLSYKDSDTWYISNAASIYAANPIPPTLNVKSIENSTIIDFQQKYNKDYGFTLKSLFTPYKLIGEQAENFLQVDVATVPVDFSSADITGLQTNLDLSTSIVNLTIDGIRLVEGHRVLIKDQVTFVELPNFVDPETYFQGNYYTQSSTQTSRTYYYYNNENGIYTYTNNRLVRTNDMLNYGDVWKLSVNVKLGDVNRDKQFHLSRLKNGYYPLISSSEPIEFLSKNNYVLRNRVDYNNVLDINYYDTLKHATQSYTIDDYTYTIPQRTIAVGEFGVIINNQDRFTQSYNFSHIINNRYKVNLRGITQNSGFYWICGDEGTILRVSKIDFSIKKIDLASELRDFKSISFYNDTRGVAVGRLNVVYFTNDGGYRWEKLEYPQYSAYNFNKVIFTDLDSFYAVGDNGVFVQFSNVANQWVSYLRKISKTIKKDDVYPLVDDLYDLKKATFTSWNLTYSATSSFTISSTKEALLISGANNNLIIYDYNNFVREHDFLYLSWSQPIGDIKSVTQRQGTNEVYIASDSIYKFDINDFKSVDTTSNNIVSSGQKFFVTDLFGSARNPSNLSSWTQISATAFGLVPSIGHPSGKNWSFSTQAWTEDQFTLPFEANGPVGFEKRTGWSKAIATASNIQAGSIIEFYTPVTYFGGTYSETPAYQNYVALNPNFLQEMVGFMDRLWLVGQTEDGQWKLIIECNQVIDPSGIPAYALRGFTTTENYISIGFIVLQESPAVKQERGRKTTVPPYSSPSLIFTPPPITFYMGSIFEFTVTVNKPYSVADYYANQIFDFDSQENIIVGNNTLLRINDYTNDEYQVFDPTFGQKLRSKLLFLDYDVASKLNFFDDGGDYRLPNSVSFAGLTSFSISNLSGEYNWLNYYKDAEKTFRYYSSFSDSDRIEFSSTFSYHTFGNNSFTFTKSNLSISLVDISPFAPTIQIPTHSRYVAGTFSLPSTAQPLNFSVYLYKYLGIFRVPSTDPYNEGDVLYLSSDVVDATLVINRILTIGSWRYLYTFTDFNESILNSLKKTNSTITVTNLNKFKTNTELDQRFELHPISIGYKLDVVNNVLDISCRFNNKTAYYNMQTIVETSTQTYEMKYQDTFLKFGFSPTYNIMDYLTNIDTGFTASKIFYSMPKYVNLPGNSFSISANKLNFGSSFEFEWSTFWLYTFVDINLYTTTGTHSSSQMLITDKYYDQNSDTYVIEFDKVINYSGNLNTLDVLSRNTLQQISQDLQILNNIQRKMSVKSIQNNLTFTNFENRLTSKFPTDSYCKILLSDGLIKDKLSGIIYTDDKYQLVLNVVSLEKQFKTNIVSTQNYNGYLQVNCDSPHGLQSGEGVVLVFNGGTFSSEFINPQYNGFQTIEIISETQFYSTTPYGLSTPISDTGYVEFIRRDAFLNYEPTDIYDLGVNKVSKVAVEITPINVELIGDQFNLVHLDMNKYKYELFDGLSVEEIITSYHWILEAEISDAKIGKNQNGLIWYSGIWKCGRWFGGTWISGTWIKGDWYSGEWNALQTTNKVINVEVGNKQINELSKWYDGRWFSGTWNAGLWFNGRRYDGDWNNGIWYNGIWNQGRWSDGIFSGGVWVLGTWKNGIFNSDNKPAYWLNGFWSGGDFENGRWFNGEFKSDMGKKSRFGTKASNSRNAIWDSGKWLSGEFFSLLNLDDDGKQVASDIHKYSLFKTGIWNQGDFYGGVIFNVDFRGGNFYGGIVDDIQIIGIDIPNNKITLNGIFRFNFGDEITIIDDSTGLSKYLFLGSVDFPLSYKIAIVDIDETFQTTTLTLLSDLSQNVPQNIILSQQGFDLRLRAVSKFSNTKWYSGLWYNGVFQNGKFLGGIWYAGSFDGDWGQ